VEKKVVCRDISNGLGLRGMHSDVTIHGAGGQYTRRFNRTKQASTEFCENAHAIVHEARCIEPEDWRGNVCQL